MYQALILNPVKYYASNIILFFITIFISLISLSNKNTLLLRSTLYFIIIFFKGTWSEMFLSEIIVKRQHNTVRVSGLILKKIQTRKIYFLLGYTEEMLSLWLMCPVKLELQVVENPKDVIYKYI